METKHTPGPWELRKQRNSIDEYDCYLYPMGIFIPEQVGEADARLMTAAPELIEALISCKDALHWVIEQGGGPNCEHESGVCFCKEKSAIFLAVEAINKATGK